MTMILQVAAGVLLAFVVVFVVISAPQAFATLIGLIVLAAIGLLVLLLPSGVQLFLATAALVGIVLLWRESKAHRLRERAVADAVAQAKDEDFRAFLVESVKRRQERDARRGADKNNAQESRWTG